MNKKKSTWVFKGKYKEETIFPETVVRLENRPAFPQMAIADENGGRLVDLPGEVQFYQFVKNDNFDANAMDKVDTGYLAFVHVNGTILEKWIFNQATMKLVSIDTSGIDFDTTDTVLTWIISYSSAVWKGNKENLHA
jgi:hypothetical protein